MDDYCYGAAHEIYAGAFSKDFVGLTFTDVAESVKYVAVKAKFHYIILLANQLASWFTSWSQTCSELEFGLSRTI